MCTWGRKCLVGSFDLFLEKIAITYTDGNKVTPITTTSTPSLIIHLLLHITLQQSNIMQSQLTVLKLNHRQVTSNSNVIEEPQV